MIAEIYQAMLDTATKIDVPEYIEHIFFIDKEKSAEFWNDTSKKGKKEKSILLNEWDVAGTRKYKKTLHGAKFAIHFEKIL